MNPYREVDSRLQLAVENLQSAVTEVASLGMAKEHDEYVQLMFATRVQSIAWRLKHKKQIEGFSLGK